MRRLDDIGNVVIVCSVWFIILLVVGLVLANGDGRKRITPYITVAGVAVMLVLTHIYLHGWMLNWLPPFNFVAAIVIGLVAGFIGVKTGFSRQTAVLIAASIPMAMMYSSGWEPSYGWGWFFLPLTAAGTLFVYTLMQGSRTYAIYILCWLAVVWTLYLPLALMEWDWTSSAYDDFIFSYPVDVTIVYTMFSLMSLVLPLALKHFQLGWLNKTGYLKSNRVHL